MPVILRNNTATIEIDINVNLQHIIGKGSFDVTILNTGVEGTPLVWLLFRRGGQIKDNISLDWRDISEPEGLTSAQELANLILSWNIPPVSINSGLVLPVYDYMAIDKSGTLTNVYTFKIGGASGTTVSILTLTYSNPTKEVLVSLSQT